jgi:hypothetical protein
MKFLKITGGVTLAAVSIALWVLLASGFRSMIFNGFDGFEWFLFISMFILAVTGTSGAIALLVNAFKVRQL